MISIKDRPSVRGLKKCLACGRWNGVKAKTCKNINCTLSITFAAPTKKKPLINPVQLQLSGSEEAFKLYSVRVRDRGPELRSFVKITDRTISSDDNETIISRNAICFVDTCKYDSNDVNISCKHVKNASSTRIKATPFEVQQKVLSRFNITTDVSNRLWKTYNDRCNHVQRISKSVFAVRCDVSQLFPTGFLHVYLHGGDERVEHKCSCACKKTTVPPQPDCDHLLLVMAAIYTNESARTEFRQHVEIFLRNDEMDTNEPPTQNLIDEFIPFDLSENDVNFCGGAMTLEMANDDEFGLELTDCQIELMDQFQGLTDHIDLCQSEIELSESDLLTESWFSETFDTNTTCPPLVLDFPTPVRPVKSKRPVKSVVKRVEPERERLIAPRPSREEMMAPPMLGYLDWLDGVNERLNLAIDFNGSGRVDAISFQVPQKFFEHFQRKFSVGPKRRLPTTNVLKESGIYAGLTMHTWNFRRLEIVQRIFHSDRLPFETEKLFYESSPGRYEIATPDLLEKITSHDLKFCRIRPTLFKTFIKLSQRNDLTDDGVFIVSWIPQFLPRSQCGEMRISFEFGFRKNTETFVKNGKFFNK